MHILVTGGAGYIGSHVVIELFRAGHEAVILDDFSNSNKSYVQNINQVVGRNVALIEGDFSDKTLLKKSITEHSIEGVIHFAAFKYVGESVEDPLKYYKNNVSGFVSLLEVLTEHDIPIVFSSSAAVYGTPDHDRVSEDDPTAPLSPYGLSKLMDEQILESASKAKAPARGIALRYFNAIGADTSGLLGETLTENSLNLWPHIVKAATGQTPALVIFGSDFPTKDGTGERDYVHVLDLADAHVKAIEYLNDQKRSFFQVYNVGTGTSTSVLEMVRLFEKSTGVTLPYTIADRRPGDPAAYHAACDRIESELNWKATRTVEDALADGWRWQQRIMND